MRNRTNGSEPTSYDNSMFLQIANGTVFDPSNGIDGKVCDVWIKDGKVVAGPTESQPFPDRVIDAGGLIVMPGGVDLHSHIAGPKVNAARRLRPDDRRQSSPVVRSQTNRSGTTGSVPSTIATGALYAGLGYTTAIDAAITPLGARHAHLEFNDTPNVDKAMLMTLGDHRYAMEQIAAREPERLREFVGWILNATKGYGIKLVNPGGVECYKRSEPQRDLDSESSGLHVTPRQILQAFAQCADDLQLPHPVHIHCPQLGRPGNWRTTIECMKSLEGRRGHFTHIQFHSYGGGPDDSASFSSRVAQLADYVNQHPNLTVDVGQVLFGETTAMTGDSAVGHFLHEATGRRWIDFDTECEAGCGIIPIEYRNTRLIHALQWAIGLEWFLLVNDPWKIALTTDHPNGATFIRYPEIIHLLMRRDRRREILASLPSAIRERCRLADLEREYSLLEIAIITRAAPARILGMTDKGHLGIGADGDVTIYAVNDNITDMFALPRFVIKAGRVLVDNGQLQLWMTGQTWKSPASSEESFVKTYRPWFEKNYSIQFGNFAVHEDVIEGGMRTIR